MTEVQQQNASCACAAKQDAPPAYDVAIEEPLAKGCDSLICAVRGNDDLVIKLVRHDVNTKSRKPMHSLACVTLGGEYKVISGLKHAHVLQMTDFNDHLTIGGESYCAAVMPRMRSDFLNEFACAQTPRAPAEVVPALAKIASAVAHLHAQNLAHNDLKPDNFFVRADGEAFLGDFGAAAFQDYGNHFQQKNLWQMRNLHYAPSEIFALKAGALNAVVDERCADIYALGQSIFVCVFRCDPRIEEKAPELCPLHKFIVAHDVEGVRAFLADCCAALTPIWGEDRLKQALDLTLSMMSPDPAARPTAAQVLQHPFFA